MSYVGHTLARDGRFHDGGHVLVFRRERQAIHDGRLLAHGGVVHALAVEPQEQGAFRGVAYGLDVLRVGEVEVGGGVSGYHFGQEVIGHILQLGIGHLHSVLCERTRLVGAYHGCRSHRLAGVHGARQRVLLHQLAHGEGEAQRDGHGQALRHGHDDECHGNHDGVEQVGDEAHPSVARGEVGVAHPEIEADAPDDDEGGEDIAGFCDQVGQAVEFFAEGRGATLFHLCGFEHLAALRGIAHLENLRRAVALEDDGALHDVV